VTHDGSPIELTWLGGPEVEQLALTDAEIIGAVEDGLRAQGLGQTTIEPRVHLEPDPALRGHFNVLRGYVAPLELAGVKIVGDYLDNYTRGLPSELGLLCLFDPATGAPRAVIDAAGLTDMRTGAVTAIGARYLAGSDAKVLGHIGARGTAYWNVRLIDSLFELDEIRVHSRRPESRLAFAEQLRRDVRAPVVVTDEWESCVRGADIVVEASRLERPEPLLRTVWIAPGALVVPYGTMSAVELSLLEIADKVVVDDWGQCATGKLGSLRAHVDAGLLTRETLHAELGEIVAGVKPGRERDDEIVVYWQRSLAVADLALATALMEKAERLGIGHSLPFG
jgi:alanine dehydrogenase